MGPGGVRVTDVGSADHRADVDDRIGGTRPMIQSPDRFSRSDSGVAGPAPLRREHNPDVLAEWLSVGDAEAAELETSGVLVTEKEAQG